MIFKFIGGSKHNQEIDIPTDQARKYIEVDFDYYDEYLKKRIFGKEVYKQMTFRYKLCDGRMRSWQAYAIDSNYRNIQNDLDIVICELIDKMLGKGR
jgi:hypothetical protein